MKINTKNTLVFIASCIVLYGFFIVHTVNAAVITEIMYDPEGADSGREWVEIYNNSSESIDVISLRLFENNVAHKITVHGKHDGVLPSGMWAIIADNADKFLIDYPEYTGLLFDSVFSLSNTGEILEIRDTQGSILDLVVYTDSLGAKGNGFSLQLHEGVFIPATPTPGAQNKTQPEDIIPESKSALESASNTNTSQISTHSAQVALSVHKDVSTMVVTAGRNRETITHVPINFSGVPQGESVKHKTTFSWNFGDGYTMKGKNVTHRYTYPGTYNVVMYAVAGSYRAVARTKVFVREPELSWSLSTSTIAIHNIGAKELNIGEFIMRQGRRSFTVPQDTIIEPNHTIYFDRSIISSRASTTQSFEFLFPNKKPVPSVNEA